MKYKMKNINNLSKIFWLPLLLTISLTACDEMNSDHATPAHDAHGSAAHADVEKGPNNGRLFTDGNFSLELAIFETGVPPEFRAWASINGKSLPPEDIDLNITLTRFGNKVDNINFKKYGDVLRGDTTIYEPHSFFVKISAIHNGEKHSWEYESYEGRTKIDESVAESLGIKTEIAGAVVMQKTIPVYGRITENTENTRKITARFDGTIKSVTASEGDKITKGQPLATVESNESLQVITIISPINGTISHRNANVGEQTNGRQLFTITNTKSVWADLSVFPTDIIQVNIGSPVTVTDSTSGYTTKGKVSQISLIANPDQSVNVRVVLNNKKGLLHPGRHISAQITTGEHTANLAVKRSGLQAFRDFTVVYKKINDEYEVRMLELGLLAGEWAEVLGGLEPGARYVSENSYVIKADIEKSGASHDH